MEDSTLKNMVVMTMMIMMIAVLPSLLQSKQPDVYTLPGQIESAKFEFV